MKLLVCDVEGTIFKADYRIEGTEYASTLWQPIVQALGKDAIEEELHTHKKWEDEEYSNYLEWVEESIQIHRKYGLDSKVFNSLVNESEYMPGVVEFFKKLDRTKYIPVLVSGGFQNLIERAQKELNIKYGFGACNYIFGKNGKLLGYNLQPTDFEGKMKIISWLFDHYGLNSKKDWIFVGDGKNDVHIASLAPLSIGIDPHEKLQEVVHYNVSNFREILPILKANDKDSESTNENSIKRQLTKLEKLEKDNQDLRKYNKKLKEQLDDLIMTKENDGRNNIYITEEDYTTPPKKSLRELLDDFKVVLIGLTPMEASFHKLSNYHKNLKIIEGFDKTFDTKILKNADFVFKNIRVMAHTVEYRAEKHIAKKPHTELTVRNTEMMENAMANAICKYYSI